jgi:ribosomal protein S27AE
MRARQRLLPADVQRRAKGLLDMLYTPDDLADDLGIDQRLVYVRLIPAGLPHTKDKSGHIWIHGLEASQWITNLFKGKHFALGENQAYCLKCGKAVTMLDPKLWKAGKMTLLKGTCPDCGTTVNRGVKQK